MLAQLSSILVPAELMLTYAVDRTWTSNNSQDWWCQHQLWCQNLCGTFSPEKPSPARKHIVCQVQCNYYVVPRFNWGTPNAWGDIEPWQDVRGGGGHYAWGASDTGTAANILYLCSHYVVGQRWIPSKCRLKLLFTSNLMCYGSII